MTKAFEEAFKLPGAEAIYFISDGAPREKGKPVDPKSVLDRVEFLNRFRKSSIYTVGFDGADLELMQSLAGTHDGIFRHVGEMKVELPRWVAKAADPLSKFKDTPEVRAVRKLLRNFSRTSLEKMLELAAKTTEVNTVRAVRAALCSLDSDRDRQTVCAGLTGSSDFRERVLLAEVIGTYRQYSGAVDALRTAGLGEKKFSALKAEVISLSQFRDREAVTALADIWLSIEKKKHAATIVSRIKSALKDITGVGGISTAADFIKWWKVARASFLLPQGPGSTGTRGPQFLSGLRKAQSAEAATRNAKVRHVAGKTFVLKSGMWVDTAYSDGAPLREIAFLSDEYWEIAKGSKWAKYLAVGPNLIVCLGGEAVRVAPVNEKQ